MGSCEHGNKPSGFLKGGEFHDRPNTCFSRTLLHGVN